MVGVLKKPVLCAVVVWLCGSPLNAASFFNWGPYSFRLAEDMTEQQAISAVGYQPNKAELTTCGTQSSSGPWDCRILTFGNSRSYLMIFERRSGDSWVVNNWSVEP